MGRLNGHMRAWLSARVTVLRALLTRLARQRSGIRHTPCASR